MVHRHLRKHKANLPYQTGLLSLGFNPVSGKSPLKTVFRFLHTFTQRQSDDVFLFGVLHQFIHRPGLDDPTVDDKGDPVTEPLRIFNVVGRQKNRCTLLFQFQNQRSDLSGAFLQIQRHRS